jgi:predicted ATPase
MSGAAQTFTDPAPLGTVARIGGRLEPRAFVLPPQPLTSFVGRERELRAVGDLLRDETVRLLTLTGPGGVGKTRVAMLLAADLAPEFADGVVFVSLAAMNDPDLVAGAIVQALGEREVGGQSHLDRLSLLLRQRHLLLVLDNFEQIVAAAPIVARLLAECAGVKALVTSRVRLQVSGEQEYVLPPLGVPLAAFTSIDDLEANPSVTLFVQRARSVRPNVALGWENADAVAAVCRQLDGLPLAIELAAARTKILPPSVLRAQLEQGLGLLTGGPRDQPARLQTLRGAIAWSYDLLPDAEQAAFRRLAIFSGGFTLEAAEQVLDVGGSVIDIVESLIDSSLLRQEEDPTGDARFGMLETIREFGLEMLAASGEEDAVRAAHAAWYLALTERAEPDMGPTQTMWLSRLEAEHPNLRVSLGWYIAQGAAPPALRQAGALWPFWFFHNHFLEGVSWLERALALSDTRGDTAGVREVALLGAGILASVLGEFDRASAWHEEGLALSERAGDPTGQGRALFGIGGVARHRGDDAAAIAALGDALALFRSTGDLSWMASTLNSLGNVAHRMGDLDRAAA